MAGLQSFVQEQKGRNTWKEIKDKAGIDRSTYSRLEDYPDSEFMEIYNILTGEYGMNGKKLQFAFGEYLFGNLADIYGSIYFEDEWDALEMIANVEETIHQSLKRRNNATFTPPELEAERVDDDTIAIIYSSDRHLCDFGKGLVQGIADYYDTSLEVSEVSCMKDDDQVCRIEVTTASRSWENTDLLS